MKYFVTTAAAALLIASGAFADDQLARSIGVEPGVYTVAELLQIRAASEDGDYQLLRQLTKERDTTVLSTQNIGASAASDQFARSVGVKPGTFTTAQMARIRAAIDDDGEDLLVRSLLREKSTATISTQSVGMGPGDDHMARVLGIDGSGMSRAALAEQFQDY
ncbi:hypothetical protein GE300_19100 [Rhodobacteraceae bacterium 2CG4]|uniref:Uncharacterized protein n=1 Tax=Halovulum marinum TaxID=2662447 RepID=A0A6L5Z539_9RHOB|nr:hypothetical protein [Halovulum marinum]MSU91691.1 hypothetical protein [Halovulum marinum]